jgi:hypothetical protein
MKKSVMLMISLVVLITTSKVYGMEQEKETMSRHLPRHPPPDTDYTKELLEVAMIGATIPSIEEGTSFAIAYLGANGSYLLKFISRSFFTSIRNLTYSSPDMQEFLSCLYGEDS